MASRSEQNLSCPVCREIFQEPVLLSCGHSFCKACLQTWWTQKTTLECPLCKRRALQSDPPLNLALKNLCEDFLQDRTRTLSTETEALCSHTENLKLFCLDDQQPVCVTCLCSETHKNHSFRPINEAAQGFREELQDLLKPLQEKLELLIDIKVNFDQTAQDIEVQAQDTERQIKDTFLMLQKILKEEEQARIDAVKKEKNQKIQMMKSRSDTLSRDTDALSDTVRATEEVLRAADLSFLQNYKTAAEIAQHSLVEVPQLITGGLIDVTKHLNNLSINILDSMKRKVTSSLNSQTAAPESTVESSEDRLIRAIRMLSQTNLSRMASQVRPDIMVNQSNLSRTASQPSLAETVSQARMVSQTNLSRTASQVRPARMVNQSNLSRTAGQVSTARIVIESSLSRPARMVNQSNLSRTASQPSLAEAVSRARAAREINLVRQTEGTSPRYDTEFCRTSLSGAVSKRTSCSELPRRSTNVKKTETARKRNRFTLNHDINYPPPSRDSPRYFDIDL